MMITVRDIATCVGASLNCKRGATAIEYGLIAALVAVAAIVAIAAPIAALATQVPAPWSYWCYAAAAVTTILGILLKGGSTTPPTGA